MKSLAAGAMACVVFLGIAACSRESVKSGYVGPASLNEDQVQQLLEQQGYSQITGLHKNGRDWVGAAVKDGRQVNFDIAADGKIETK